MIVTLWGTRGSLASPGPETVQYGGNTSCVSVYEGKDILLVLDAGTGIRRLGLAIEQQIKRIDIFLTHLHLDHIQGLGFFSPLYQAEMEVHIYGPAKSEEQLRLLLTKYLSLPLFPVNLRDLPCRLFLHALSLQDMTIGNFTISAEVVCHPGLTVGYRVSSLQASFAYLPDHEPALGVPVFPLAADWTSGYRLALNADLLIHDTQYSMEEYIEHVGWGHSSVEHALRFAALSKVKSMVTFHHDPSHDDHELDVILSNAMSIVVPSFKVYEGWEGRSFNLGI